MSVVTAGEQLRPPEPSGLLRWLRRNLFNSFANSLLTLVALAVGYLVLRGVLQWVFVTADWRPITRSPLLYLVGQYPRAQLWRVGVSLMLVSAMFGLSWGVWRGIMRSFAIVLAAILAAFVFLPVPQVIDPLAFRLALLANPVLVFAGFVVGSRFGLRGIHAVLGWTLIFVATPIVLRGRQGIELFPPVETSAWGGLLVTLILAVGGIVLSFPIGVLLAFGRRSSLPIVSLFSTGVIELVRGVPLVSILFMSSIILALFLPSELRIDRLIRALIGMTLFSAAYTAENVRGGLQSIPKGQYEAAKAIGLNGFQTTVLIILPQALRAVIPAIVGQFISLFKDTTLAVIVGIIELLNIGRSIIQSDPEFIQLQAEVYLFIAAVFWLFSSVMSYASRQLETALGVGER